MFKTYNLGNKDKRMNISTVILLILFNSILYNNKMKYLFTIINNFMVKESNNCKNDYKN